MITVTVIIDSSRLQPGDVNIAELSTAITENLQTLDAQIVVKEGRADAGPSSIIATIAHELLTVYGRELRVEVSADGDDPNLRDVDDMMRISRQAYAIVEKLVSPLDMFQKGL